MKRLYRSEDKVIAGVIGGLGEYFSVDPTILRLAFILLTVITGVIPAIIAYIIACLVVPKKGQATHTSYTETPKSEPVKEEPKQEEKKEESKTEEVK